MKKQNEQQNSQEPVETPQLGVSGVVSRFVGYKIGALNDNGYPICERCGCHSYYDERGWDNAGVLMRPIWYIQRKCWLIKLNLKGWFRSVFLGDNLPF